MRAWVVLCAIIGMGVLTPLAGAADWLPAADLSDPAADTSHQRIAATADGTTFVAWVRQTGALETSRQIVIRQIGADGVRGVTATITESSGGVEDLALVATAQGGAVVVWRQAGAVVRAQRIQPDGSPDGLPFNLTAGESSIRSLSVAPGPNGPIAVWASDLSGDERVRLARIPAAGAPTAPIPVSVDNDPTIGETALAIAPDGDVRVVWQSTGAETEPFLLTTHVSAQGVVGAEGGFPIADEFRFGAISVAPLTDGRFWIAALQDNAGAVPDLVALWRAPAAGGPPALVDTRADTPVAPGSLRLAVGPDDRALVGWITQPDMPQLAVVLFTRADTDGVTLPTPDFIPTPEFAFPGDLRVAVGTDGAAMFLHRMIAGGAAQLRAVRVGADGTIGAPRTLSPIDLPGTEDPYDPTLVAAPNGEYAAAWGLDPGATDPDRVTQYAHFDATAPALTATIPATAIAGEPEDFSVDASDRADAEPFTYRWDFGDGATSAVEDPEHTYAAAGQRTVTVRVTDRAGNSAEVSRAVTVSTAVTPVPIPVDPGAGLDLTAPVISGLSITPRAAVRGTPRQTTRRVRIAYRLSEAARVRAVFDRRAPGLRGGRACVAPTAALRRNRARACVRFVRVATLTRSGARGANRIDIARLRVGARTLVPGLHRVTLTATDTAGNRSAPRTTTLTVRRAPRA